MPRLKLPRIVKDAANWLLRKIGQEVREEVEEQFTERNHPNRRKHDRKASDEGRNRPGPPIA